MGTPAVGLDGLDHVRVVADDEIDAVVDGEPRHVPDERALVA
jgi:hypothetical protein